MAIPPLDLPLLPSKTSNPRKTVVTSSPSHSHPPKMHTRKQKHTRTHTQKRENTTKTMKKRNLNLKMEENINETKKTGKKKTFVEYSYALLLLCCADVPRTEEFIRIRLLFADAPTGGEGRSAKKGNKQWMHGTRIAPSDISRGGQGP